MTSVSYLFRSTGGVIGLCASQAIFQGIVKYLLTEKIQGPDAEEVTNMMTGRKRLEFVLTIILL